LSGEFQDRPQIEDCNGCDRQYYGEKAPMLRGNAHCVQPPLPHDSSFFGVTCQWPDGIARAIGLVL